MINLLSVVEDPFDEIALAGALRSPFFGVSDEGLFRLATAIKDGGLTAGVYKTGSEGRFALRADVAPWVSTSIVGLGSTAQHVTEAVQAADFNVDFRRFDNDGPDGVLRGFPWRSLQALAPGVC